MKNDTCLPVCKNTDTLSAEARLIDVNKVIKKLRAKQIACSDKKLQTAYRITIEELMAAPAANAVEAEKYNDLREAFVDYVCSGEPSPAPWCKNKNGMCVNGWGHCLPEYGNCQGFNPDGRGGEDA